MQYRTDKHGEPISILGFGCMRLTMKGGSVDIDKAAREVQAAVDAGINYFDTAYLYKGNEAALGEVFERLGCRDRVNIATKLPQYLVKRPEQIEKYFQTELERLRTDHIDYYLMHMLTDLAGWKHLQALGIEEWAREKKAAGQIRNFGFSFHGNSDAFLEILDAYDWDFCQIQYNYMDEVTQAGRIGLQAAAKKGIPVIIMEPLRGGKLVDMLPPEAERLIEADPKGRSAAELAFTWLWDQPEVTCVLSGMNSLQMLGENVNVAESAQAGAFTEEDRALVAGVKAAIEARIRVPCTGCRYCMPCPQGVDIPGVFRCYNSMFMENKMSGRIDYLKTVSLRADSVSPSKCVGCGKCERICPQGISVITELKKAKKALLPPPMAIASAVGRKFFVKK